MVNLNSPSMMIGMNTLILSVSGYAISMDYYEHHLKLNAVSSIETIADNNWRSISPRDDRFSLYSTLATSFIVSKEISDGVVINSDQRFLVDKELPDDSLLFQSPTGTIPLIIRGIMSTNDQRRGMVILEYNGQQKSYLPGDSLDEGIVIARIFADRVIFTSQGYYVAMLTSF